MLRRIIFFLLLLPACSFAQYFEVGLKAGASNYMGDLSPVFITPIETHPAGGAFFRFNPASALTLQLNYDYGRISGDDDNGYKKFNKRRNLGFRSDITEYGFQVQWNMAGFRGPLGGRSFSPYLYAGVAYYHFNPKANFRGAWVDLAPLMTEGRAYALNQFSFPLGLGFKRALNDHWNLGFDIGFRKTLTDYLDDVSSYYPDPSLLGSQTAVLLSDRSWEWNDVPYFKPGANRGNPAFKDWYVLAGITLSYVFGGNVITFDDASYLNPVSCPSFGDPKHKHKHVRQER